MNIIQRDKLLFEEVKRQMSELKEQNKKMHEALVKISSLGASDDMIWIAEKVLK